MALQLTGKVPKTAIEIGAKLFENLTVLRAPISMPNIHSIAAKVSSELAPRLAILRNEGEAVEG